MTETVDVRSFLNLTGPLIDVRSPGEFNHAHIPDSRSLPLLDDAERAQVGTTYKQKGEKPAVIEGLALVGSKISGFAATAVTLPSPVRIYCFRGGMRSQSMAWFFELVGTKTITLKGGYKAFRRFVLHTLSQPYTFHVLGGLTGCGKTEQLRKMAAQGHQVLDLEALAGHRGSAFGLLGLPPQGSNEAFENKIALALHRLNPSLPIWVEDESRMIGSCKIPDPLFHRFAQAPHYLLELTVEQRLKRLIAEYSSYPPEQLTDSVLKITRKLGGARTKEAVEAIEQKKWEEAFLLLLKYYDSAYLHSTKQEAPWIPFSPF